MAGSDPLQSLGKGPPQHVGAVPVGHDPLDPHPQIGEALRRVQQEPGGRSSVLVGEDPEVGHPRVIVHRHVDVVVAHPDSLVGGGGASSQGPMPSSWADASELLHVNVQELTRSVPDVADGNPSGPVRVAQA